MRLETTKNSEEWEKAYIGEWEKTVAEAQKELAERKEAFEKAKSNLVFGSFTDKRDGQTYKTVKIGNQTWMAENLNFEIEDSWCYDDDPENGKKYGRLYTWYAATAAAACPSGWHLPSVEEFGTLIKTAGGKRVAGKRLMSKSGRENLVGDGTDAFGFSAMPAGYHILDDFYSESCRATFWSATEDDADAARGVCLISDYDVAGLDYDFKDYAFSVRCLKDSD